MPMLHRILLLSAVFASKKLLVMGQERTNILNLAFVNFTDCNLKNYYDIDESPATWDRAAISRNLVKMHRNSVPMGSLNNALMVLDKGSTPTQETVKLIYSDKVTAAKTFGSLDSWTYEHLWPTDRGVTGRPASTDVQNLRPEQTRVKSYRRGLFYGSCGTVEYADVCKMPAESGLPDDTALDKKIWLPPASVRGDIARALMYMDLRYSDDAFNLTLTDCPPFKENNMGYLSQLIEWHLADPVDTEEQQRNFKACNSYQGNRNIFVDYPELVSKIFGEPQQIQPPTRTYPSCLNVVTQSPTPEPNSCSFLEPGDVQIWAIESDNPDNIGFMALADLEPGLELFITDNAWTGSGFSSREGVVRFDVPDGGIKMGEIFGYGRSYGANFTDSWFPVEGMFDINVEGDTLIVYCELSNEIPKPILAMSLFGAWKAPGLPLEEYGTQYSALPMSLVNASIALAHHDNYKYVGKANVTVDELRAEMRDSESWEGSDVAFSDGRGASVASRVSVASITVTTVLLSALVSMF